MTHAAQHECPGIPGALPPFFLCEYKLPGGQSVLRVAHMLYFVKAQFQTKNGLNVASGLEDRGPARPLRLGVAQLYECQIAESPGVRERDDAVGRPPEMLTVTDVRPPPLAKQHVNGVRQYVGLSVLDLRSVWTQMVPRRERGFKRHFVFANKLSGRTEALKL